MAEKTVNELLKKYLGISVLRITIGVLMLLFGTMILAWPDLLAVLVAIYLVGNKWKWSVSIHRRSAEEQGFKV